MFTLIMRVIRFFLRHMDQQLAKKIAENKIYQVVEFVLCKLMDLERVVVYEPFKKRWDNDQLVVKVLSGIITVYVLFIIGLILMNQHDHIWLRISAPFIYQNQWYFRDDIAFIRYSMAIIPLFIVAMTWFRNRYAYYTLYGFLQLQKFNYIYVFWSLGAFLYLSYRGDSEISHIMARSWFWNIALYYLTKASIRRIDTKEIRGNFGFEESKIKIFLKAATIVVVLLSIQLPLETKELAYKIDFRTQQRVENGIVRYKPTPSGRAEFNFNKEQFAVGSDKMVHVYDTFTKEVLDKIPTSQKVWGKGFSPDGKYLAIGYEYPANDLETEIFSLYDLENKRMVDNLDAAGRENLKIGKYAGDEHVVSISFSPDGKYLSVNRTNGLEIWDVTTKRLIEKQDNSNWINFKWINSQQYMCYSSKNIYFSEVGAGKIQKEMGIDGSISGTSISPDGNFIAIYYLATGKNVMEVLNTKTNEKIYEKEYELGCLVGDAKFTSDNRMLIVALDKVSKENKIELDFYDMKTFECERHKMDDEIPLGFDSIEIMKDMSAVICINDNNLTFYDLSKITWERG